MYINNLIILFFKYSLLFISYILSRIYIYLDRLFCIPYEDTYNKREQIIYLFYIYICLNYLILQYITLFFIVLMYSFLILDIHQLKLLKSDTIHLIISIQFICWITSVFQYRTVFILGFLIYILKKKQFSNNYNILELFITYLYSIVNTKQQQNRYFISYMLHHFNININIVCVNKWTQLLIKCILTISVLITSIYITFNNAFIIKYIIGKLFYMWTPLFIQIEKYIPLVYIRLLYYLVIFFYLYIKHKFKSTQCVQILLLLFIIELVVAVFKYIKIYHILYIISMFYNIITFKRLVIISFFIIGLII